MTTILYNGINPFEGLSPTPLISKTATMVRFGGRWGQKHEITLRGQLTGQCISYEDMLDRQQALLTNFNKDFQSLNIYDGGLLVTGFNHVKIGGISFEDSTYAQGLVPYSISVEAYPENYFSGEYGVLEPLEQVSFSEEEDGKTRIVHTTSARGFCTSSSSLNDATENARSWVAARTGWNSQILPAFINGIGNGVCLQTIAENYDRLNASYEVVESYIGDQFGHASQGILRYTTDFSSNVEDGFSTISLQGELKGCRYQDLTNLRNRYATFNAFQESLNQFSRITNNSNLNSVPVTKGLSEDVNNKVIVFNYTYNDDMSGMVSIAYTINFDYDFESDVISASVSATVSSRAAYSSTKWASVLTVANSLNLYSLVAPAYATYVNAVAPHLSSFPLNQNKISSSRTENELMSIVALSASYSNAPASPYGLDQFSSKISVTPALHKYSASPILDGFGQYYLFDLGFVTRGSVDISVDGVGSESTTAQQTLAILKTQVQNLRADYFNGSRLALDSQSYTTGNLSFGKSSSVSASFSAESTEFTL